MTYDPDGNPAVDPNDPDAVAAYLDNPVVKKLHEDLGRQFRALPAEEQLAVLIPEMEKAQHRYDSLAAELQGKSNDDPRQFLLYAQGDEVEEFRARIIELGGTPPS